MPPEHAPGERWPSRLDPVFERSVTCEYASLTRAGAPVTVPTTPYVGTGGATLDVSTGLTYPAKAERARRNPKVALLFADRLGSGMDEAPVVLVQGHAAVRDADVQANADRYARVSLSKLPEATRGQPKFVLRRMAFYYARIWVEVTPLRMRWWPDRRLSGKAEEWQSAPGIELPASDPAPTGRQPPPWLAPPSSWRDVATAALGTMAFADLTVIGADGFPVVLPVEPGPLDGDTVPLGVGPGAPELAAGPACLTLHTHPAPFTGQENHTLVGSLVAGGGGTSLRVERALAGWSLAGNRLRTSVNFLVQRRRLAPRLEAEAARRGQPVPRVNFP